MKATTSMSAVCWECGSILTAPWRTQKFCRPGCRSRWHYKRSEKAQAAAQRRIDRFFTTHHAWTPSQTGCILHAMTRSTIDKCVDRLWEAMEDLVNAARAVVEADDALKWAAKTKTPTKQARRNEAQKAAVPETDTNSKRPSQPAKPANSE
jgi:hypothetical protein